MVVVLYPINAVALVRCHWCGHAVEEIPLSDQAAVKAAQQEHASRLCEFCSDNSANRETPEMVAEKETAQAKAKSGR